MFTGIIQYVGRVLAVATAPAGRRLTIDVGPLAERLSGGSSVAVDGACLTVRGLGRAAGGRASSSSRPRASFDVVPETLRRTTLGDLSPDSRVNLEPALAAGAALDGHLVLGHVDGLARVTRVERGRAGHVVRFRCEADLAGQMVPKGSIALAGVSLTLAEAGPEGFSVALVPYTLSATTLGSLRVSDRVNVELDIIGKYVRRCLGVPVGGAGVTLQRLREAGFA